MMNDPDASLSGASHSLPAAADVEKLLLPALSTLLKNSSVHQGLSLWLQYRG